MLCLLLLHAALQPPVFTNDFAAADALTQFDDIHHADRCTLVADPTDATNTTLRIDVAKGEHYGAALNVRLRNHLKAEPTRLYFRYRLWIDATWSTSHGGKLPGFGGTYGRAGWGGRPSDGHNGWSARGMFSGLDAAGHVPIGSYIYHADMAANKQQYGNGERWGVALQRGRWYTIEQEIQLDTIGEDGGSADGWLKAWVDGMLVFDRADLHVRDTDTLRIETVWLNIYHGGKTPSPADMHLLIDDVWISTSRPVPDAPAGPAKDGEACSVPPSGG